jgi:hypothetical protein
MVVNIEDLHVEQALTPAEAAELLAGSTSPLPRATPDAPNDADGLAAL